MKILSRIGRNSMENTQPLAPETLSDAAETLADKVVEQIDADDAVADSGFGDILRDFETQKKPEREDFGRTP